MRWLVVSITMLMVVLILLPSVSSVKVVVERYELMDDAIKWTAVPGENYVVYIYRDAVVTSVSEYTYGGVSNSPVDSCGELYQLAEEYGFMVGRGCSGEAASILIFTDSRISLDRLLQILSRISYDGEIRVYQIPYEKQDFIRIDELLFKQGLGERIWEELNRVFGPKSEGLIGIGSGIYEGGLVTIYSEYFSDEDISTIFRIVRKYIPEDIRFTVQVLHYMPEIHEDPLKPSAFHDDEAAMDLNPLIIGVILAALTVTAIFLIRRRV